MSDKYGTSFEGLVQAVSETTLDYPKIEFPLAHVGGGVIEAANGPQFKISDRGVGYIGYRTKGDYKQYRRFLEHEQYEEAVTMMNADWITLGAKRKQLVAAIYNGELVGLLTTYSPVVHEEILALVKEAGLHGDVTRFAVDEIAMRVFIDVAAGEHFVTSLKITNGHSGHLSFGYSAVFKVDGYEFDMPLSLRRRHAASIDAAAVSLKEVIQVAKDLKIDRLLKDMPSDVAFKTLTERMEALSSRERQVVTTVRSSGEFSNGFDVVVALSEWTTHKGYGSSTTRLIDRLINAVLPRPSLAEDVDEVVEVEAVAE